MKKSLYHITESLLSMALLLAMIFFLSRIVENKLSYTKYNEFYQYSDDYDVLFCGSSHMMNAALPMELWKKYGIKSYNIANGAETIPVSYHVINNALDHSSPKVIVLDVFYAYSDSILPEASKEQPHQFFDMVPVSNNKKDAVFDILKDSQDRWNYLFDFSIYHSRWNELTREDFFPENENMGGARMVLESYSPRNTVFDPPELHEMARTPKTYLEKIKDLCDERNIHLICVVNPYAKWQENRLSNVDFEKEMDELGIDFVDLRDSDVVDIFADSADTMHVNICGERKLTDYYGSYLKETGINFDQIDPEDAAWNKRYQAYINTKAGFLSMCEDCSSLLTDLNDPDFIYDIQMRSDAALTDTIKRMLANASAYENARITTNDTLQSDIWIRVSFKDSSLNSGYFIDKSFSL